MNPDLNLHLNPNPDLNCNLAASSGSVLPKVAGHLAGCCGVPTAPSTINSQLSTIWNCRSRHFPAVNGSQRQLTAPNLTSITFFLPGSDPPISNHKSKILNHKFQRVHPVWSAAFTRSSSMKIINSSGSVLN